MRYRYPILWLSYLPAGYFLSWLWSALAPVLHTGLPVPESEPPTGSLTLPASPASWSERAMSE